MKEEFLKNWQRLSALHQGVVLGALAGLFIGLFFALLFGSKTKEAVSIVVMRKEVKAGIPLKTSDLGIRTIPKEFLPRGSIHAKNAHLLTNRSLRIGLDRGSGVRWVDVYDSDQDPNQLSAHIPQGYRAVAISFGQQSMESFLTPGDRIDILGHFQRQGNRELAQTIFQNIKVMKTNPQLVLLLKPEEAELLYFAQQKGTLAISLRQRMDDQNIAKNPSIDFDKVLGLKPSPRSPSGPGQILTLNRGNF